MLLGLPGTELAPVKRCSCVDKETGFRKQLESTQRVKQWRFTADDCKQVMNVRRETKMIALAKGENSMATVSIASLVPTSERPFAMHLKLAARIPVNA